MDLGLVEIVAVLGVAFAAETIDSCLGMLYGTLVAAFLVGLKFPPLAVVPAVLASEAFAGFVAARHHQRLRNMDVGFWRGKSEPQQRGEAKTRKAVGGKVKAFFSGMSRDLKVALMVVFFGSFSSLAAVLVAINIPETVLKTYIGGASLVLGMLLVVKAGYSFSWVRMVFFSIVSAFTNALGGGGFGVLLTSGQIVSGRDEDNAVGVTTLAEFVIGLVGFAGYWFLKGIPDWELIFFLCFGAFWGARLGPPLTNRLQSEGLRKILGVVVVGLGFLILYEVWVPGEIFG